MYQQSELEAKFYGTKTSEHDFVIVPSDSERKFLHYVRMCNKSCNTVEEIQEREEYFKNITMQDLVEIRLITNLINTAWSRNNSVPSCLPMMNREGEE